MLLLKLALAILSLTAHAQCGSIFMYMPYGTRSHWHAWRPLAHELASRGHRMTVMVSEMDEDLAARENVDLIVTGSNLNAFANSSAVFEGRQILDFSKAIDQIDQVRRAKMSTF